METKTSLKLTPEFAEAFVRECWYATHNDGTWQTIATRLRPIKKISPKTVGTLIEKLRRAGVDMPYNLRLDIPAYNPKKSFRNVQMRELQSRFNNRVKK
jgi:hypothetical protein